MISILMVCGNGCGSSLVCQMAVEAVLNELGVKANIDHSDMLSAASKHAEILIRGLILSHTLIISKISPTRSTCNLS